MTDLIEEILNLDPEQVPTPVLDICGVGQGDPTDDTGKGVDTVGQLAQYIVGTIDGSVGGNVGLKQVRIAARFLRCIGTRVSVLNARVGGLLVQQLDDRLRKRKRKTEVDGCGLSASATYAVGAVHLLSVWYGVHVPRGSEEKSEGKSADVDTAWMGTAVLPLLESVARSGNKPGYSAHAGLLPQALAAVRELIAVDARLSDGVTGVVETALQSFLGESEKRYAAVWVLLSALTSATESPNFSKAARAYASGVLKRVTEPLMKLYADGVLGDSACTLPPKSVGKKKSKQAAPNVGQWALWGLDDWKLLSVSPLFPSLSADQVEKLLLPTYRRMMKRATPHALRRLLLFVMTQAGGATDLSEVFTEFIGIAVSELARPETLRVYVGVTYLTQITARAMTGTTPQVATVTAVCDALTAKLKKAGGANERTAIYVALQGVAAVLAQALGNKMPPACRKTAEKVIGALSVALPKEKSTAGSASQLQTISAILPSPMSQLAVLSDTPRHLPLTADDALVKNYGALTPTYVPGADSANKNVSVFAMDPLRTGVQCLVLWMRFLGDLDAGGAWELLLKGCGLTSSEQKGSGKQRKSADSATPQVLPFVEAIASLGSAVPSWSGWDSGLEQEVSTRLRQCGAQVSSALLRLMEQASANPKSMHAAGVLAVLLLLRTLRPDDLAAALVHDGESQSATDGAVAWQQRMRVLQHSRAAKFPLRFDRSASSSPLSDNALEENADALKKSGEGLSAELCAVLEALFGGAGKRTGWLCDAEMAVHALLSSVRETGLVSKNVGSLSSALSALSSVARAGCGRALMSPYLPTGQNVTALGLASAQAFANLAVPAVCADYQGAVAAALQLQWAVTSRMQGRTQFRSVQSGKSRGNAQPAKSRSKDSPGARFHAAVHALAPLGGYGSLTVWAHSNVFRELTMRWGEALSVNSCAAVWAPVLAHFVGMAGFHRHTSLQTVRAASDPVTHTVRQARSLLARVRATSLQGGLAVAGRPLRMLLRDALTRTPEIASGLSLGLWEVLSGDAQCGDGVVSVNEVLVTEEEFEGKVSISVGDGESGSATNAVAHAGWSKAYAQIPAQFSALSLIFKDVVGLGVPAKVKSGAPAFLSSEMRRYLPLLVYLSHDARLSSIFGSTALGSAADGRWKTPTALQAGARSVECGGIGQAAELTRWTLAHVSGLLSVLDKAQRSGAVQTAVRSLLWDGLKAVSQQSRATLLVASADDPMAYAGYFLAQLLGLSLQQSGGALSALWLLRGQQDIFQSQMATLRTVKPVEGAGQPSRKNERKTGGRGGRRKPKDQRQKNVQDVNPVATIVGETRISETVCPSSDVDVVLRHTGYSALSTVLGVVPRSTVAVFALPLLRRLHRNVDAVAALSPYEQVVHRTPQHLYALCDREGNAIEIPQVDFSGQIDSRLDKELAELALAEKQREHLRKYDGVPRTEDQLATHLREQGVRVRVHQLVCETAELLRVVAVFMQLAPRASHDWLCARTAPLLARLLAPPRSADGVPTQGVLFDQALLCLLVTVAAAAHGMSPSAEVRGRFRHACDGESKEDSQATGYPSVLEFSPAHQRRRSRIAYSKSPLYQLRTVIAGSPAPVLNLGEDVEETAARQGQEGDLTLFSTMARVAPEVARSDVVFTAPAMLSSYNSGVCLLSAFPSTGLWGGLPVWHSLWSLTNSLGLGGHGLVGLHTLYPSTVQQAVWTHAVPHHATLLTIAIALAMQHGKEVFVEGPLLKPTPGLLRLPVPRSMNEKQESKGGSDDAGDDSDDSDDEEDEKTEGSSEAGDQSRALENFRGLVSLVWEHLYVQMYNVDKGLSSAKVASETTVGGEKKTVTRVKRLTPFSGPFISTILPLIRTAIQGSEEGAELERASEAAIVLCRHAALNRVHWSLSGDFPLPVTANAQSEIGCSQSVCFPDVHLIQCGLWASERLPGYRGVLGANMMAVARTYGPVGSVSPADQLLQSGAAAWKAVCSVLMGSAGLLSDHEYTRGIAVRCLTQVRALSTFGSSPDPFVYKVVAMLMLARQDSATAVAKSADSFWTKQRFAVHTSYASHLCPHLRSSCEQVRDRAAKALRLGSSNFPASGATLLLSLVMEYRELCAAQRQRLSRARVTVSATSAFTAAESQSSESLLMQETDHKDGLLRAMGEVSQAYDGSGVYFDAQGKERPGSDPLVAVLVCLMGLGLHDADPQVSAQSLTSALALVDAQGAHHMSLLLGLVEGYLEHVNSHESKQESKNVGRAGGRAGGKKTKGRSKRAPRNNSSMFGTGGNLKISNNTPHGSPAYDDYEEHDIDGGYLQSGVVRRRKRGTGAFALPECSDTFKGLPVCPVGSVQLADHVRESLGLLLGALAKHLPEGSSKIEAVVNSLVDMLDTPSFDVQSSVSRCLTPLAARLSEKTLAGIVEGLLDKLANGANYGQRKGAAFGLAAFMQGTKLGALRAFGVVDALQSYIVDDEPTTRQGALFAYERLFEALGPKFEPYVVKILPELLKCFGDKSEAVRLATNDASRVVMSNLTAHGVKMILPLVLEGLKERKWRAKVESIQLLGAMSFCAPRQLSQSLPVIVPKLLECLSEPHTQVKDATVASLTQIGSVIRNPEISRLVPKILEALANPTQRTKAAIVAMIRTTFVHVIDPASLALIVPILRRALRSREAVTKKMGAQIAGNMCSLIEDVNDLVPYASTLLQYLQQCLNDPLPEVRGTAARSLGSLYRGIGEEHFSELIASLMNTLYEDKCTSGQRSGAAQALSELLLAQGPTRTMQVVQQLQKAGRNAKACVRESLFHVLLHLPVAYGDDFAQFISSTLPAILEGVSDTTPKVRDTALQAGQTIMCQFAQVQPDSVLPYLRDGLTDSSWQVRRGSAQLLGTVLLQLAQSGKICVDAQTDDLKEAINVPNDQQEKLVILSLGEERHARIMAQLYLLQSDPVDEVAAMAFCVWKNLVPRTPRMLRHVLPVLMQSMLADLCCNDQSRRVSAGIALGSLVQKMGVTVLDALIPVFRKKLVSAPVKEREGICFAIAEIIRASKKRQIAPYIVDITRSIRNTLCDRSEAVRTAAGAAFKMLYTRIGKRCVDEVIPAYIRALRKVREALLSGEDPEESDVEEKTQEDGEQDTGSLARMPRMPAWRLVLGVTEVLKVSSQGVLVRMIPFLCESPVGFSLFQGSILAQLSPHLGSFFHAYSSSVTERMLAAVVSRRLTDKRINSTYLRNVVHAVYGADADDVLAELPEGQDALEMRTELLARCGEQVISSLMTNAASNAVEMLMKHLSPTGGPILSTSPTKQMEQKEDDGEGQDSGMELRLQRAAARLTLALCRSSQIDLEPHVRLLLRGLLHSFAVPDRALADYVVTSISTLLRSIPERRMMRELPFMRSVLDSVRREAHGLYVYTEKKDEEGEDEEDDEDTGSGDETLLYCLGEVDGLRPLWPVLSYALVKGIPDARREAAVLLADLAALTPGPVLSKYVLDMTGPLIRIIGEIFPPNVKAAALKALSLLIKKCGPSLRAFVPQLQPTFVKCFSSTSESVRNEAVSGLAALMPYSRRVDAVVTDLVKGVDSGAASGTRQSMLEAICGILVDPDVGEKVEEETLDRCLEVAREHLTVQQDQLRKSAGRCVAVALQYTQAVSLLEQDLLSVDWSSTDSDTWMQREAAVLVASGIVSQCPYLLDAEDNEEDEEDQSDSETTQLSENWQAVMKVFEHGSEDGNVLVRMAALDGLDHVFQLMPIVRGRLSDTSGESKSDEPDDEPDDDDRREYVFLGGEAKLALSCVFPICVRSLQDRSNAVRVRALVVLEGLARLSPGLVQPRLKIVLPILIPMRESGNSVTKHQVAKTAYYALQFDQGKEHAFKVVESVVSKMKGPDATDTVAFAKKTLSKFKPS